MMYKTHGKTRQFIFSCSLGCLFWLLFPIAVFAQQIRVTGVVTDSNKDPLIGASVLLKGTSTGVTTDMDGNYGLEVPANGVLVFSYIGFISQEIAVNGRSVVNVSLADDSQLIDEVVVVGYGTMKKSDLTGSVGKVSTEELTQLSTTDIGQAIAGRVAGVDVISNSGEPGSGNKIRVRGYGTINSSDPLYVVDGFPVSDIDYLSPQDIESLEILKDASATAIYGSRGANGVVLIKTKGGQFNSKVKINATIYGSMAKITKTVPLLNAWEFATLKKELYANSGMTPGAATAKMFDYVIDNKYEGTDWTDEVSRTAYSQNYNVDVNGGSERQTFSVGATYAKTEGILKYNDMDIVTVRANNTYKLNHGISLSMNVVYSNRQRRGGSGDGNYYGSVWPSVMRADPLAAAWDYYTDNWGEIRNSDSAYQPARMLYLRSDEFAQNKNEMLIGNMTLQIENLFGFKGLSFSSQYGIRRNFGQTKNYTPVWYVSADQNNMISRLTVNRNNFSSWLWNGYMTYNKTIGKHNMSLMVGAETQEFESTSLGASASDVPYDPNNRYIDMTESPSSRSSSESKGYWERMASFFVRANYSYASKYLLTVTGRADGSSKFIKHWGYFPSFSLGWNLQEENFIKDLDLPFSQLKLRAGWGKVGNSNSAGTADVYALMVQGSNAVINNEIRVGSRQEKLPNPELQWEAAEQLNFGLDFGLFNMRLSGTLDYFIRTTRDMILATQIPLYVGNTRPNMNLGEMRNNGFEVTVRWNDQVKDFSYSIGINASMIKNKVLSLGTPDPVWGMNIARLQQPFTRTVPGKEMAHFYGYKTAGIFQTWEEVNNYKTVSGELMQPNAAPGDVKFVKTADDGLGINDNDRTYLGSGMPDVTLGFNASAAYKGFDISLFMQASIGNEIANAAVMDLYSSTFEQFNMSKKMMNRWTGEGSTNKYPRLNSNDLNQNSRFSDRYIENGSYLRMKNIQLGYTLPVALTRRFKVERLRVYASVDNVFVITGYSGFDPELGDYLSSPLNNGIDLATYPRPRTLVAGLNLTF